MQTTSSPPPDKTRIPPFTRPKWALLGMVLLWTVVLAAFAIARHQRLNSSAYDLAIKSQVIWNLFQGHGFASSIEVTHYLGDHVQLIMVLLAPLFGVWADVRILLIVQSLLLALGAVPTYRIARRRLGSAGLALAFAAAYLLYPTVGFVNRFDFHPLTFTIFFLFLAYDLLEVERPFWASLVVLLALTVREDVGFTVFAFGLYVALVMGRRRLGAAWAVLGLSWSLAAIFVVIPHFRGAGSDTLARYAWLGGSPLEMVETAVTQPGLIFGHIFGERFRAAFLLKLLLPVGYLALLSPLPLLIALPNLSYNLLSATPSQSSIYFQYISPIIPFIFIAAIGGAARLRRWLEERGVRRRRAVWLLAGWLALGVGLAWVWDNPFTQRIEAPYFPVYALEQETAGDAFWAARELIPPQASVATMSAYAPHLALRRELHLFADRLRLEERPYGFPQTDYYLLNLSDFRWGVNARFFHANIEIAIGVYGYESIFFQDDVVVLTQTEEPQPSTGAVLARIIQLQEAGAKYAPAADTTIRWMGRQWVRDELPQTAVSQSAAFARSISLLGYDAPEESAPERPFCPIFYWRAAEPLENDYTIFFHLVDEHGYVHAQRDRVPAQGFYPTSAWTPGEIVADMHCLQIPPQLAPGQYGLNIGLYDPNSGERLPLLAGEGPSPAPGTIRVAELTVNAR